ncbi:MAG: class I SAM-dependent methyltransferase [Rhodobacteraceae bacterium]|nr:class I SAM-dependent methyltransferase [Paracoccaceae bacterium]NNK65711.1 class I SAM-dependent methyltransferase [Paracoccaceae bacterium]
MDDEIQYIFVEAPHWLDEAYDAAIAATDTGIIARNTHNIDRISWLLARAPKPFRSGVDIGAGHGHFVRGMRDQGFPFFWQDKYAENLFARGFEAGDAKYDVAVAFEVLEHLENPAAFLEEAHAKYGFDTLFFTATCFQEGEVPPEDWWYWAHESGQHISFFSRTALEHVAERLDMRLFHLHGDLFAMSRLDWSRVRLPRLRLWRDLTRRSRPSLTMTDHEVIREGLREKQAGFAKD